MALSVGRFSANSFNPSLYIKLGEQEALQTGRGASSPLEEKKIAADSAAKGQPSSSTMDHRKLLLGPSLRSAMVDGTNSSDSEAGHGKKRKLFSSWEEHITHASVDLQLNNPLPVDWEQCLDLQSGRMYCINRNTLKRSWEANPKEKKKLDLDLNISNLTEPESLQPSSVAMEGTEKRIGSGSDSGMVAVVCLNCYLLVMLPRSSPACPNCKYVHSLRSAPSPEKMRPVKPLETLSLLH